MKPGAAPSPLLVLGGKLKLRLQDPQLLRIVILAFIAVVGLGAVGLPLYHKASVLREELAHERKRQSIIKEYKYIDGRMKRYKKRLAKKDDLDSWIQYFLDTTRKFDVKVTEFKPFPVKGRQAQTGALQGILLRFDVMAPYHNVLNFLGWLENQNDIIRITRIYMLKESATAPLKTSLTFGVLMGKPKAPKKSEEARAPEAAEEGAEEAGAPAKKKKAASSAGKAGAKDKIVESGKEKPSEKKAVADKPAEEKASPEAGAEEGGDDEP